MKRLKKEFAFSFSARWFCVGSLSFLWFLPGALPRATGQTNFTILRSFSSLAGQFGFLPLAGVIRASDGWLYGTAVGGGTNAAGAGTVFRVQINGAGFAILKSFGGLEGQSPMAPVIEGSDGNLYGTTYGGGLSNVGTVFKLAKDGSGYSVLHHFSGGSAGANLSGALLEGSDGFLYGTTVFASSTTRGTIFKIDKGGNNYSSIHVFTGTPDGQQPACALVKGDDGALYGGTPFGGAGSRGTIFKINEDGSGYAVIRDATAGAGGPGPSRGLIKGSDGFLYGVVSLSSSSIGGGGLIFKLDQSGGNYAAIHTFTNSGTGLYSPGYELLESGGTLYGTAVNGGPSGKGGIFKLNPDGSGYTVLRNCVGTAGGGDADQPMGLLRHRDEVFYGTAQRGGQIGTGCVFVFSSDPLPPRDLALSVSGGSSIVQFNGTAAAPYVIERSTNLNTWSNLVTIVSPIHGATSFTNDTPPQPAGFYRVRQ